MSEINFAKRIYLGIAGEGSLDWHLKLKEVNRLGIDTAAVFLSRFDKKERDNLYRLLLKSSVKTVPLVHLREDVTKDEIKFFIDNFKTRHFNIHESDFGLLDKWTGFWDKLYLEMDYDSKIAKDVKVRRIGGFCVDLSHLKSAIARGSEEAYYIFLRKNKITFACNHLNGFDSKRNKDKHTVTSLNDFDYLTTLPKYVFGEIIALEVENGIQEQIKFKEHLVQLLNDYFNEQALIGKQI